MEEIDVWRTANVLIKLHGDRAAFVAAERADELFAKVDFMGAPRCSRALRAKPREGDAVN